jgi:DNA polymerase III epsilon subunit-like protein
MIVVDIETSGLDLLNNGIWQIGAIDTDDPDRQFLEECRIDDNESAEQEALDVCGVSTEYVRSKHKISQKELLKKFFEWCQDSRIKTFVCQHPQFDAAFLRAKALKHEIVYPFQFRAYDLHSIASLKYLEVYGELPLEGGFSNMNLSNILFFCGIQDKRDKHNALEDAKLTAECFIRILYGKNFLKEFEQYSVPQHLKQL